MFEHFYHQTIRRVSAVFGTLFNDIQIKRFDSSGNTTETITVPLRYAPKTKWYSRVFADNRPDSQESADYALKVPSMGFELSSILYDTSRKLNKVNKIRNGSVTDGSAIQGYAGTPYTMTFNLYVFANKTADWSQIIEQIIPNFNPTFNVPIKLIHNDTNGDNIVQDVHITLTSVSPDVNMYGDFRSRQTYTWNLSFDMNVNIYGDYKAPGGIIGGAVTGGVDPAITINFYDDQNGELTLEPGQEPISIIEIPEI